MLGYLKQVANTRHIVETLDMRVKDYDDEFGARGQHYIVTVIIQVPDFTLTSGNQRKSIETKCLVSVKGFMEYVEKQQAVIWL